MTSRQGDLFAAPPPAAKPATPAPRPVAPEAREAEVPAPASLPVPAWRQPRPEPRVLTVSQLTGQLKELLEPRFERVLVRGEVFNFRGANARGHLYFGLKDEGATLDVKLWANQARALKFQLKDGLSVVIEGALNVYAPQGRYSLIVQRIEPEGVGALALAFEQLKQKLSAEGLIGPHRTRPRRPLPLLPRRVGVVTSVTGAALRDFLKVLGRRHPRLPVLVADARVQGAGAAEDVRRALRWLGRADVDVIVVTRGGGSTEDLWTFNEEPVVRAIFDCPVPVISAVGHEIDTTLADLVADVRAPTPSAAAELVVPVLAELELSLAQARARLARSLAQALLHRRHALRALAAGLGDPRRRLTEQRLFLSDQAERLGGGIRRALKVDQTRLRELGGRLQRARPQAQLQARRERLASVARAVADLARRRLRREREALAGLSRALERRSPRPALEQASAVLARHRLRLPVATRARLTAERARLGALAGRLDALSPLAVLARGYAIVQRADGRVVRRAADSRVGDALRLRLGGDDELLAAVTEVKPGGK